MLGVICQLCRQRPACLHVTEQVPTDDGNLETRSLDICHHCLSERGIADDTQLPGIEELRSGGAPPAPSIPAGGPGDLRCPVCSLTLGQFVTSKRFGCAHDYDAFGETIIPLLEEFQGSSHHIGRIPNVAHTGESDGETYQRRLDCERQLQEAIAREDYEEAAKLRDALRDFDR